MHAGACARENHVRASAAHRRLQRRERVLHACMRIFLTTARDCLERYAVAVAARHANMRMCIYTHTRESLYRRRGSSVLGGCCRHHSSSQKCFQIYPQASARVVGASDATKKNAAQSTAVMLMLWRADLQCKYFIVACAARRTSDTYASLSVGECVSATI